MNISTHKLRKLEIREFMRKHYTDERLAMLLAHARDGKLNFSSCCCFIGIATADHALRSEDLNGLSSKHLKLARELKGAEKAEIAFLELGLDRFRKYESTNGI